MSLKEKIKDAERKALKVKIDAKLREIEKVKPFVDAKATTKEEEKKYKKDLDEIEILLQNREKLDKE